MTLDEALLAVRTALRAGDPVEAATAVERAVVIAQSQSTPCAPATRDAFEECLKLAADLQSQLAGEVGSAATSARAHGAYRRAASGG